MTDFQAAQERFNRASHSDALREMQIPAEVAQFEPIRVANYDWMTIPIAFALGVVLTVVWAGV